MENPNNEEQRLAKVRTLQQTKQLATGLLLAMTVVFVFAKYFEPQYPNLGIIRAFAEAAMVGALADWFAVTALFRHPLGLPIPHTNLISNNQERIGQNLGAFVTNNFLADRIIGEKLDKLKISIGVAEWLQEPENSTLLVNEVVRLAPEMLNGLDDTQINSQLKNKAQRIASELDMGSVASDALQYFVQQKHHELVLEKGLGMLQDYLQKPDNRTWIKQKFTEPNRFLSVVDSLLKSIDVTPIADRILDAADNFLNEIAKDPEHRFRNEFNHLVGELIHDLKHSPEYKQKITELQKNVLQSETVSQYSDNIWTNLKSELLKNLQQENSKIKRQMHQAFINLGLKVSNNPSLQDQIDNWLKKELKELLQNNREWIAQHISAVVKGWDKNQVADILEVEVGRDLQFIRINGTIVGGAVGVLLYLLFDLLPHLPIFK